MNKQSVIFKFVWILYPIAVFFLIVYSFNEIQGGGASKINKLLEKKDEAATEEQKLRGLQEKLAVLKKVDMGVERDNLTWTVKALPAAKEVWLMMAEINNAASSSGAVVMTYSGSVGNVVEATAAASASDTPVSLIVEFSISDYSQLQQIISVLEKSLPLVSIAKVNYTNNVAKVTFVGGWAGWGKSASEALSPLPEYQASLTSLKSRLQDFIVLPEDTAGISSPSSASGVVNPF